MRSRREEGNALVLMPAAVLILFVLMSIAIDTALTFNAQRQLSDMASGIANDAATAIVDSQYYADGTLVIDPAQAQSRAAQSLAQRRDRDGLQAECTTAVAPSGLTVTVDCTGRVQQLISPLKWIGIGSREIGARAQASPVQS